MTQTSERGPQPAEQPSTRLLAMNHTGFTVADIERSIAFYRDGLGLVLLGRQEGQRPYLATITGFADVYLRTAWLAVTPDGGHVLELLEYTSHPAVATARATNLPGNGHLCFQVEDIAAVHARLLARGVPFISPPTVVTSGANAGAVGCYLRDPDGFTLELLQRPAAAPR